MILVSPTVQVSLVRVSLRQWYPLQGEVLLARESEADRIKISAGSPKISEGILSSLFLGLMIKMDGNFSNGLFLGLSVTF